MIQKPDKPILNHGATYSLRIPKCPVSEVRCIKRMGVFHGFTLTLALSHDGRRDFSALDMFDVSLTQDTREVYRNSPLPCRSVPGDDIIGGRVGDLFP